MTEFIDLKRRFRDLRDAELDHPEFENTEHFALDAWGLGSSIGWSELLEHPRVVLLAEAGAGKTRELSEQAKRLVEEGRQALFVPLESLDREPLKGLLPPRDEERFAAWKADVNALGWFFLDAVDELKLTDGKLDRALLRLSRDIDGQLDRVRIIVSCRPSDWRSSLDLTTIQSRLPVLERRGEIVAPTSVEVFMAALQHAPVEPVRFSHRQPTDPTSNVVRTVAMLPMNDDQIMEFAQRSGVTDANTLLEEIAKENAWDFARRPLDLADLISSWRKSGRLGTREDQHEANVTAKLRDDPERPDHDVLTDSAARIGAESLALSLTLARARAIRPPERVADVATREGVLDADTVLPKWTEAQRQSLLRRALFDPATYGRIRFHHRSVQEYLAACRLRKLRADGMSRNALSRLLFGEIHGVKVVRPSMRAVAAWLALWDPDVLGEVVDREPEALLSLGDPSALGLEARARLLRAFVAKYGQGGWRGLDIPMEEVRRISCPELADVVRDCWSIGASNVDVRNLLMEMIWHGPMAACVDLAHAAALDVSCGHHCRITAMRALVACGGDGTVRQYADSMLADPVSWPDEVVCHVAADLFPRIISAEELTTLMEMRHEPEGTAWGFHWISKHIAKSVDPRSKPAVALRERVADLIFRTRRQPTEPYRICGKFSYLAPALAALCERQLSDLAEEPAPGLISACVIASRFGARETDPDHSIRNLKARFEAGPSLRSAAFWSELAFIDEIGPMPDEWERFYHSANDGLGGSLTEADRPWLADGLGDESRPERRPVALHALIDLGFRGRSVCSELDEIRRLAKEDEGLLRLLAEQTAPPTEESRRKLEEMTRERERRQQSALNAKSRKSRRG